MRWSLEKVPEHRKGRNLQEKGICADMRPQIPKAMRRAYEWCSGASVT